jgi:glutamate/tyrosine decarboxylase-like PLP-dependent enzyme
MGRCPRSRQCGWYGRSWRWRIPERNLATFVTTFMEPEARVVIDENLHRSFIDHAEYPIAAEIE